MIFSLGRSRCQSSPCETRPVSICLSEPLTQGKHGAYGRTSPHCRFFGSLTAYEQEATWKPNQLYSSSIFSRVMWFSHHLAETRLGLDVTNKMMKHETRCKLHPRKWLQAKEPTWKLETKFTKQMNTGRCTPVQKKRKRKTTKGNH